MDLGHRLAIARATAGKPKATLRDKLYPGEHDGTVVPSVESDGWLEESAEGAPPAAGTIREQWAPRLTGPLTQYVARACEIGLTMRPRRGLGTQHNVAKADAARSAAAPASAVALIAARNDQPQGNGAQPTAAPRGPLQRRVSTPPPPPPPRRSRLGEGLPYLDALPTPSPRPRAAAAATRGDQTHASRRPPSDSQNLATPWLDTSRPPQHTQQPEHVRQLREAQHRVHEALAHARKQELLKTEAQMRARHAEQWIAQYSHQTVITQPTSKPSRLRRNLSAALVFCVAAFMVGSYLSLLLPMRKRVLLQEAALHELDESHQDLTRQNEALMQQLSGQPAIEAP